MFREKIVQRLVCLLGCCLLFACGESALEFAVRYDTLGELQADAPVYLEGTRIGQVEKVVSTEQGDFLVYVAIDPQHKQKATSHTKFYILDDPQGASQQALVVEQGTPGGAMLKDGSVVQGEKPRGFFGNVITSLQKSGQQVSGKLQTSMRELKKSMAEGSREFSQRLEESLEGLDNYFQELGDSLESALQDEEIDKLEQSLDEFIREFKSSSEAAQKQMREEILPELRKNFEALKKKLQQQGRDEDADKIDGRIDQLTEV